MKLKILIPTFNRYDCLYSILRIIEQQIDCKYLDSVEILIADNSKSDYRSHNKNMRIRLDEMICSSNLRVLIEDSGENIGLVNNALFCLRMVEYGEYFLWHGDDDILPAGYINFILRTISEKANETALFYVTGIKREHDYSIFTKIIDNKSDCLRVSEHSVVFENRLDASLYSSQLTGACCIKDPFCVDEFASNINPNLYLFIGLTFYCSKNANKIYEIKSNKVVFKSNEKDWSYGSYHLIDQALMNYQMDFNRLNLLDRIEANRVVFEYFFFQLGLKRCLPIFVKMNMPAAPFCKTEKIAAFMSVFNILFKRFVNG